MRINALTLHGSKSWPSLCVGGLSPGLNVFHGPPVSGKTTLADLVSHALYGRRLAAESDSPGSAAPNGEVIVENRGQQYRLRRSHDAEAGERLTVAGLGHAPVDGETVRQLVGCLSTPLLQPLFAVSFRESPRLESLLSSEFSQEFRSALWRLKWAPPTVQAELRPIYARLRALETQVASLVRGLGSPENQAASVKEKRLRSRNRRASYYLAQLTGGELLQLRLGRSPDGAHVVNAAGDSLDVNSLWSTQRDLVYLSLCLALVAALARHGVRLPLVLDEPFERLDARGTAALVAVLGQFGLRGHQLLTFTNSREAVEHFVARGAAVHEMQAIRIGPAAGAEPQEMVQPVRRLRRRIKTPKTPRREAG